MTRRFKITGSLTYKNVIVTPSQRRYLFGEYNGRGTVLVSNEYRPGWRITWFARVDKHHAIDATGVLWCIAGLRRAGIRFREGGKLWWKVVTP